MTATTFPDLSVHTYNPNIPLVGHEEVRGSALFLSEPGITYYQRDDGLDRLFLPNDPATPKGTARILITPEAMRLRAMTKWVTGCPWDSLGALSRAIVSHNFDITRTQWDNLIKATGGGEDFLLTGYYASFAFAKTGKMRTDEEGEYPEIVALFALGHVDREWDARIIQLDSTYDSRAGYRLVLRNGSSVP